MRKTVLLACLAGTLFTVPLAAAASREGLRERLRERAEARRADGAGRDERRGEAGAVTPGGTTIAYGSDPLQQLSVWQAKGRAGPAPLVLFVHGGGWSKGSKDNATGRLKAPHFTGNGYAFASIDYRLVPAATVEQQAADVAASLKALLDRADQLGIDRSKVVLMGHSAGAHLVALVGTDERYLRAAGLSFGDVDGVIPIDGAAYDVAAQVAQAGPRMKKTYTAAFGTDPARQSALSPITHAAGPNAAAFYIPHVQREDGVLQSNALAAALRSAGTRAETASFPGESLRGHMEINRKLGDPDYPATPAVDAWLRQVFGR